MQEIKDTLKSLGTQMQHSSGTHRDALRERLASISGDARQVAQRPFVWKRFAWGGLGGAFALVAVIAVLNTRVTQEYRGFSPYEDVVLSSALSVGGEIDAYDVSVSGPEEMTVRFTGDADTSADAVIDYEQDHGAMLAQTVNISLLTEHEDAVATIAKLISSLDGHLVSLHDQETFGSISGSIPTGHLSLFYDGLRDLVKNDAFLEKTLVGDSMIPQILDVESRISALQTSQSDVEAQLQAAKTSEEKAKLQQRLDSLTTQIANAENDRQSLEDRADYVDVAVSVDRLPSLWRVHGTYELREIIAGYEQPNVWQKVEINVLEVFFVGLEVLSATFWIVIPVAVWGVVLWRRRKLLREVA